MGKIICATRGGEASARAQDAAIKRAKQGGDELVFFFAYDLEFLEHADYALRADVVEDEMDDLGEFLMTIAVERAERHGVKARYRIAEGSFGEKLANAVREEKATLVVLGRPEDDGGAFELDHLREFVDRLQKETRVPFVILPE